MEYLYVIVDDGGNRIQGIISKTDFDEWMTRNETGVEVCVILTINEVANLLQNMKNGQADLTVEDLLDFTRRV